MVAILLFEDSFQVIARMVVELLHFLFLLWRTPPGAGSQPREAAGPAETLGTLSRGVELALA